LALAGTELKMNVLKPNEIRIERLRSEIAHLEARYDGLFPPGVYTIFEGLQRVLAALHKG
jgi:hypothetical protein